MRAPPRTAIRLLVAAAMVWHAAPVQAEPTTVPEDLHVFLLVGQSNMAGRAKLEPQDRGVIDNAFLWNLEKSKWEPAEAPVNRYSIHGKAPGMQRLNPGPGFAKAYLKANPGVSVGIICAARGGTRIEQWEKGREKPWPLYDTSVEETRKAIDARGTLKGILWHQGESNSSAAAAYPAKLKTLVETFRQDFRDLKLPFVFAQLGPWRDHYAAFNAMIVKQPDNIPHTACVRTDGLKGLDAAHFDTASQRELGRRYADAMAKLLSRTAP